MRSKSVFYALVATVTAAVPAYWVRWAGVMLMSCSWVLVRGWCCGDVRNVGTDVVTGRHHMM